MDKMNGRTLDISTTKTLVSLQRNVQSGKYTLESSNKYYQSLSKTGQDFEIGSSRNEAIERKGGVDLMDTHLAYLSASPFHTM
jgi:hypothetical protein